MPGDDAQPVVWIILGLAAAVLLSWCFVTACHRHPMVVQKEPFGVPPDEAMERIQHAVYGAICIFRGPDLISSRVRGGGLWEEHIVREMARWYRPGTDLCDVGANLGLNTLLLHRVVPGGITGCVHCFEPQADVFTMLAFNMSHLPTTKLYNMALADVAGLVCFQQEQGNVGATIMGGCSQSLGSRCVSRPKRNVRIRVAALPLDSIGMTAPISLMKIDVETAEVAFLRGATDTLKRHRPTLVMEVFPSQMDAVTRMLSPLGYQRRSEDLGEHNYVFAHHSSQPIDG